MPRLSSKSDERRGVAIQHLIDPELCTACLSCMAVCPNDAIVNEGRMVAVDPDLCQSCKRCLDECPSGAVDTWRERAADEFSSLEEQFSWDRLP